MTSLMVQGNMPDRVLDLRLFRCGLALAEHAAWRRVRGSDQVSTDMGQEAG